MHQMRASKSPERRAKIDALLAQTTPRAMDVAAHVLTCITRGAHSPAGRGPPPSTKPPLDSTRQAWTRLDDRQRAIVRAADPSYAPAGR